MRGKEFLIMDNMDKMRGETGKINFGVGLKKAIFRHRFIMFLIGFSVFLFLGFSLHMYVNKSGSGWRDFFSFKSSFYPNDGGGSAEKDVEHIVKEGEKLEDIALVYGVDQRLLALYNGLTNLDALLVGQSIIIPSKKSIIFFSKSVKPDNIKLSGLLRIYSKIKRNKFSVTANFQVETKIKGDDLLYRWNLGNGQISNERFPTGTYFLPGTYIVKLTIFDKVGNSVDSNSIYVDVPYNTNIRESGQRFITIGRVGEIFSMKGRIVRIMNHEEGNQLPFIVESEKGPKGSKLYRALTPGFYHIVLSVNNRRENLYLYISYIDSVNTCRSDINWYRTQYNTGFPSNCGPTVVSMAIAWARGKYVSVADIRAGIGYPYADGSVGFDNIEEAMKNYGLVVKPGKISLPEDIFGVINRDHLAIILFQTGMLKKVFGDPGFDPIGRYYDDEVGHYTIIKGYTVDKKYFIVYDPIPGDWGGNVSRYNDGVSMIGRNRYYPVDEMMNAFKTKYMLEVCRNGR